MWRESGTAVVNFQNYFGTKALVVAVQVKYQLHKKLKQETIRIGTRLFTCIFIYF